MKLIPAGEFMMGDTLTPEEVDKKYPGGELSWYESAHPRHKVKISKPFYMGAHEVTVGEFRKFVEAAKYQTTAEKEGTAWGYNETITDVVEIEGLNWHNPEIEQGSNHPVTCVSWEDATAYIKWLNEQKEEGLPAGYQYALPSEAQWEYACRAGSETTFFWGEEETGGKGYINGAGEEYVLWVVDKLGIFGALIALEIKSKCFLFSDGYKGTSPVGSFQANDWGLYDMLGNVAKWCSDWHGEEYYKNSPETDPTGPDDGSGRVFRGGSWYDGAGSCRSANRGGGDPTYRNFNLGFRLALVPSK